MYFTFVMSVVFIVIFVTVLKGVKWFYCHNLTLLSLFSNANSQNISVVRAVSFILILMNISCGA